MQNATTRVEGNRSRLFVVVLVLGTAAILLAEPRPAAARIPYDNGDQQLIAEAEKVTGDQFVVVTSSPRGVRIFAIKLPNAELVRAIDSGLTELFEIARRHGYSLCARHADYTVFIGHADRTRNRDGQYSPDIAVGAEQYAGSIYDQGGYVFAAGMVLSMQPCAFIFAEHDHEWQRVINVARYEGEHLILYHNDRKRFDATMDHSRGGSHPILE